MKPNFNKYLLPRNIDIKKCILITGDKYSFILSKKFKDLSSIDLFNNMSESEINNSTTIIGFGGGKTLDKAKKIAYQYSKTLILIPSTISNDGIASPLLSYGVADKVVYKEADFIIWDFVVENKFPDKYFYSALGDVFSSYSAINDFIKFSPICDKTKIIYLIKKIDKLLENDFSLKSTIEIIEYTGKTISNYKSSYPVSASEHKIAHAINKLGFAKNILHGNLVGSISLFTLYLQRNLNSKFLKIADILKIEKDFTLYDVLLKDNLLEIFKESKNIRKNRITILDNYSPNELLKEFHKFEYAIFEK